MAKKFKQYVDNMKIIIKYISIEANLYTNIVIYYHGYWQ